MMVRRLYLIQKLSNNESKEQTDHDHADYRDYGRIVAILFTSI